MVRSRSAQAPAVPIAALYPRVSSAAQAESKDKAPPHGKAHDDKRQETSLETQEAACERYAREHGYVVDPAHVYREVHTGVELWERPQLTRLRKAVRRREVTAVVAYAIDRLARDPVHLGVILSEAEHAGVAVHFVTEPLDESPEGQLIRFVRGYAAKVEHEKIKERTIRGHRARVMAGKPWGARAPYGYRWADETRSVLVVDPLTGAVVRRIFRDALAGIPLRALVRALMEDGIPSPSGGSDWWMSTLREMLHNPVYTGRMVALRWQTVRSASGRLNRQEPRPLEEQVVLPVACEALVSEADFAAVQERLTRNKAQAPRNNSDPTATLLRGGFVRCGLCGLAMSARFRRSGSSPRRWHYDCSDAAPYGCARPTIRAEFLDTAVWETVTQFLQQPALVHQQLEALRQADPAEADLAAVDSALADVERKQRKGAQALLLLDEEAAGPVVVELEALAQQVRQLRGERDRLLAQQGAWRATQTRLDDLETWCQQVAANLAALDHASRRLAVEALDLQVRLYPPKQARRPEVRWEITAAVPLSPPHIVTAGS